jgi:hypothetical protein
MVAVPLGLGAYKRLAAGEPEVRLVNRYVEKDPSNLREHLTLLARGGSSAVVSQTGGSGRGNYSKAGLFNGDLFSVFGPSLFRFNQTVGTTQITGTIAGTGFPYLTWMKGIGYEFLFISDGNSLQYFSEHAAGTLTLSAGPISSQVIQIGGIYYTWGSNVDAGTPAGTSSNPWIIALGTGGANQAANDALSLANLAAAINFSGTSGITYSSALAGARTDITAQAPPIGTTLVVQAIANDTSGNSISTTVPSGSGLAWGATTLTGGGGTALQTVTGMGASEVPKALASVSGYVLVSVANTSKFYWLNPGEVTIDPLNFASKESNPDNILDMLTVGDNVLICGNGSAENWYATGTFAAPFAPIEGRVYQRGVIEGTPVVVRDSVVLVGDDGVVYEIGYQFGTSAQWGVHPISNSGIAERIRTQLRREQGLVP